jgi:membrane-anchored protein YejM (alkaline phosphatase superfamily)
MERHGLLDREEYLKRLEQNQDNTELVSYPLEKIEFDRRANPLNILVVSVNNLRADALSPETMPVAYQFAQNSQNFANHYSSSNDSFGVFGLFYGLPSSYSSSIKTQGSKPILIDTLIEQGYEFGLFSGDNFDEPLYGETVFRGMNFNGIGFNNSQSADQQAVQAWSDWASKQGKTPWFSYLELTTVDNFTTYNTTDSTQTTGDKLKAGYLKSVAMADSELELLLSEVEALGLADSTVIVITSNHGTEFNETETNSWGANSNYSRYQLQVPMVIQWPGKVAATFEHRTSHLDFSVTLLQDLLGVS